MKHLKSGNVCYATKNCPFGKKDGLPFLCAASTCCAGYTGKEKNEKEKKDEYRKA